MINPQRGEVWLVDLNPTVGQEMQKTRPVVIMKKSIIRSGGQDRSAQFVFGWIKLAYQSGI
jgi:hypothetical protein